ncbi:MAG TPA: hypothetical protein VF017_18500 [Thermoanaerobaculia bacterium]|nr:hypothetical protein [Thermoanaerobaculia bacterium]
MSKDGRALPETLASALAEAAGRRRSGLDERRRQLERRRDELLALHAEPARVDGLRACGAERAGLAERLRRERAELEDERQELALDEADLESRLDAALAALRERCRTLVARLPSLANEGSRTWVEWLEDWHHRHHRAFEPGTRWAEHIAERNVAAAALEETVRPLLGAIDELEITQGDNGVPRNALGAEIEKEIARIRELEVVMAGHLERGAPRFGQILDDLPRPGLEDSAARLERVEGLLAFLEETLGRFAASAWIERQMLEALQ